MNIDEIIIGNILRLMRQKGLSQRTLAKNAKINYENFNRLMKGGRSIVKSDVLPLVAAELGVTKDELMTPAQTPSLTEPSTKEQLIADILVRLSALDETQLRAASLGIKNAILAAASAPARKSKGSAGA